MTRATWWSRANGFDLIGNRHLLRCEYMLLVPRALGLTSSEPRRPGFVPWRLVALSGTRQHLHASRLPMLRGHRRWLPVQQALPPRAQPRSELRWKLDGRGERPADALRRHAPGRCRYVKTRHVFSETVRKRVTRKRADSRVWNVWKMAQRGKSVDAEAECMLQTCGHDQHQF